LKDARSEAAKEIEELKAQKNAEYQNFVSQVNSRKEEVLSSF
jgi:V-type H+-transporting ATPase subunit G